MDKANLRKIRDLFNQIEEILSYIEKIDPYGDLTTEFKGLDGSWITKLPKKTVEEDIDTAMSDDLTDIE